jgi:quinolinate synthase
MQDFYRCEAGYKATTDVVATTSCKKLVVDMHYEAQIQAIVSYHDSVLGEKVTKQQAQTMSLTRDQYLQVKSCMFGTSTPCMNLILCSDMQFTCLLCR